MKEIIYGMIEITISTLPLLLFSTFPSLLLNYSIRKETKKDKKND